MHRRILHTIRLDKIAAVDQPCQQHATVAIIKRAPAPTALLKATFGEALQATLVSDRVSEAFYRAFDGLYQRNNAFREALTDELSEGGDGGTASEDYLASVRALVESAVEAARKVETNPTDETIEKAIEQALIAKFSPEETTMKITDKAGLTAEITKFDPAKSPVAHVDIIRKAATDLKAEDLLPADGPLAKAVPDPALGQLQTEIAILKLAPVAKTYFDTLDEAGKTVFLAKSATEQNADVEKANATDPIVYTTKAGIEVRKSAGETVLALAKSNDAQAKEIAELRGDSIEKRAGSEFPHVAKDVATAMLKSASALGVETEAGKGVLDSLATMNKTADPLFKRIGASSGSEAIVPQGVAKARVTFKGKVDEIAARDKITKAAAMEKAEVEAPELFAEAYPAVEPAEADVE